MATKKVAKQKKEKTVEKQEERDIVAFATTFKGKKRTETFLIKRYGPTEFRTIRVAKEDYEGPRLLKKDVSNWETDKDSRKAVVKDPKDVEEQAKSYLDLKKDIFESYEVRQLTADELEVELTTMYI